MYKSTSDSMQHRARHPGPKPKFSATPRQRQRATLRVGAFKKIIASELKWQSIKLPQWIVSEIRILGLRRWLDVQHKRSDDAAATVLRKSLKRPKKRKNSGDRQAALPKGGSQ